MAKRRPTPAKRRPPGFFEPGEWYRVADRDGSQLEVQLGPADSDGNHSADVRIVGPNGTKQESLDLIMSELSAALHELAEVEHELSEVKDGAHELVSQLDHEQASMLSFAVTHPRAKSALAFRLNQIGPKPPTP